MPKVIIGVVSSSKTDKTITVVSHGRRTHPIYKKQYPVSKSFLAHDEKNEAMPGDKVSIIETRPISARKHFKLEKIIERPKLREDKLTAIKVDEQEEQVKSKSKKTELVSTPAKDTSK